MHLPLPMLLPLLLASASAAADGSAVLALPPVFSDGLVLQTWAEGDARAFVYGTAAPGAAVNLTMVSRDAALPYAKGYFTTAATATGRWAFQIDGTYMSDPTNRKGPKYGPYEFTVRSGGAQKVVKDVVFGDVYICSGDADMARTVGSVPSAASIVADAGHNFSSIRLFGAASKWGTAADGAALREFSALCFLSGRDLRRLYNPTGTAPSQPSNVTCPMGLLDAASPAAATLADWGPPAPKVQQACATVMGGAPLGAAFTRSLQPLLSLAIRGFFWSLSGTQPAAIANSSAYAACFQAAVSAWRDGGNIGDWSLALTQAAGDAAVGLQLAQAAARPTPGLTGITTTSLAPMLDLPRPWLHEAAQRLALGMLHTAFSKMAPELNWGPPRFVNATASHPQTVRLVFDTRGGSGPLVLKPAGFVEGSAEGAPCSALLQLSVCDVKECRWTNATSVTLSSDEDIDMTWSLLAEFPKDHMLTGSGTAMTVRYGAGAGPTDCMLLDESSGIPSPVFEATLSAAAVSVASAVAVLPPLQRSSSAAPPDFAPPPMGFNSWNRWHCWVDEHKLKETADKLVALNLAKAGYTSLNVDDCWQAHRTKDSTGQFNGTILAEPSRFPSGLKGIADYIHSKGLRFGVYTAQCSYTCQLKAGSYQHEAMDAKTYCDAGVDYLKIDACGPPCHPVANTSWIRFRAALDECKASTGRHMLMAVSSCNNATTCGKWVASGAVSADIWRTTNDIQATWGSIMNNLDKNNDMAPVNHAHPGHYNDPDMLQVGNIGLSQEEQISHFALWCLITGPLLISTDLNTIDKDALAILTSPELIAINQDPGGIQGVRVSPAAAFGTEVYTKKLANGDVAAIFINRSPGTTSISADFAMLGLPASAKVTARDLWKREAITGAVSGGVFTAKSVVSHSCLAVRLAASKY